MRHEGAVGTQHTNCLGIHIVQPILILPKDLPIWTSHAIARSINQDMDGAKAIYGCSGGGIDQVRIFHVGWDCEHLNITFAGDPLGCQTFGSGFADPSARARNDSRASFQAKFHVFVFLSG
jgi:hypothetical protein